MKTALIIISALALAHLTFAESQCEIDTETADYARFEKWLLEVYAWAPLIDLEVHPGAEDETEFFYLHCWQSDDFQSAASCVRRAKEVWGK